MAEGGFNALLDDARRGSEAAWSEIYRDIAPAVLGYLRANRAPDPEDTMSEVFLQVARDVGRFDGDERGFRAWVFTICHHRLIDARRSRARRPVDPVAEPPEPVTAGDELAEGVLGRVSSEGVREALEGLSDDQRAVLLLRVVGDLTVAEVAEALGKRQGAIKALQRRGLASLERELARKGVTP